MARLRTNLVASYAGQGWTALIGILFIPVYLRILGPEPFALVGLMLSLQAISQILDFGIGSTLNRELALRSTARATRRGSVRQLVGLAEVVAWSIASVVGVLLAGASGYLASNWLNPVVLASADVAQALLYMAAAVSLAWPATIYAGALQGMERHVELNVATVVFATLRSLVVIPVMQAATSPLLAFLSWQAFIGLAHSLTLRWMVWRGLPDASTAAAFDSGELRGLFRFAGAMFGVTATGVLLSQLDRLVISSTRPLEELGYYGVAISVAAGLGRMVTPMFAALYPRFSRLISQGANADAVVLFHHASQWLGVLVAGLASVLVFFARDILFLWTGDGMLADRVATVMIVLVIGSSLSGITNVPYALILAAGHARFAFTVNVIALVIAVPYCILATSKYGIAGAASTWLLLNLAYVFAFRWRVRRDALAEGNPGWLMRDIIPTAVVAAVVAMLFRFGTAPMDRTPRALACLMAIVLCTLAASAIGASAVRHDLRAAWQRFRA